MRYELPHTYVMRRTRDTGGSEVTEHGQVAQDEIFGVREPEAVKQRDRDVTPALAIARTLWGKRTALKKAILVGFVVGVIISLLIPRQYTSTVHLMPPEQGSGAGMAAMLTAITSKAGLSSGFAGDLLGMKGSGTLFVGILGS